MIIHFAIFIGALIYKLIYDTGQKSKGIVINHFLSAFRDLLIYLISIYFFSGLKIIGMIGLLILTVSLRWILFDPIFAKINWGVWDKHGTTSKLDVFLTKLGKYHFLIKIIPLAIGLAIILWAN